MRKKSKLKNLIALLLAFIVLIVLFFVVTKKNEQKDKTDTTTTSQTDERHIVSSVNKDDINQIVIQNEEGEYTLNKDNDKWTTTDSNVNLNQSKVSDIVYCFTTFEAQRTIESATNLAQYGLDNAKTKATAILKDGSKKSVFIGNKTLDGMTYYAMLENDPNVYVVWNNYGSNLNLGLKAIRDISFSTNLDYNNIQYISFSNSKTGKPIEMHVPENKPSGVYYTYEMTKPYSYTTYVYAKNLDDTLDVIFELQPEDLVDSDAKDLSKYGLNNPSLAITIKDNANNNLTYEFGLNTADGQYAYVKKPGDNKVYTVKKETLESLYISPMSLISKNATLVNIEDVKKVEVINNTANKNYTLDINKTVEKVTNSGKEEEVSKFTGKFNGKDLDDSGVKKLYQQMLDVIVDGEKQKDVTDTKDVSIKYTLNDGSVVTVEFAPYSNDFYSVFVNGKSEFVVDKDKVNTIINACEDALK